MKLVPGVFCKYDLKAVISNYHPAKHDAIVAFAEKDRNGLLKIYLNDRYMVVSVTADEVVLVAQDGRIRSMNPDVAATKLVEA